jgi:hypothetical protein
MEFEQEKRDMVSTLLNEASPSRITQPEAVSEGHVLLRRSREGRVLSEMARAHHMAEWKQKQEKKL